MSNIITLKLKYYCSNSEDEKIILNHMKQYTSLSNFTYNRLYDANTKKLKLSTKELTAMQKSMNNIELMDSHFKNSSIFDMKRYPMKDKIIFGTKANFVKRSENKISKSEWKKCRLRPICSIGEANERGNRKFKIVDETKILFKPSAKIHVNLNLYHLKKNYKSFILKVMLLQNEKKIPITYKLDENYVYVSFDLDYLNFEFDKIEPISNRIMSIDMNPNYVGFIIMDMNNDGTIKRFIKNGVISIKPLNDKSRSFEVSCDSPIRKYFNNKRSFEIFEICKRLSILAKHYRCEIFALEDLNINASDKCRGKRFNRLVNNEWCRTKFTSNLIKRLKIFKIKIQPVIANYSSIIGNLVYRYTGLPDMILAAIEIGRRGFLFDRQYITKTMPATRNIIFDDKEESLNRAVASMEECGDAGGNFDSLENLVLSIKKTQRMRYRVPIERAKLTRVGFRLKSTKSYVFEYEFT